VIEVRPEMAEIVGNLLSILGPFVSTLSSATVLKREEERRNRELEEAKSQLDRLQAELCELKKKLGYDGHTTIKPRARR
jgi:hypothetical protein